MIAAAFGCSLSAPAWGQAGRTLLPPSQIQPQDKRIPDFEVRHRIEQVTPRVSRSISEVLEHLEEDRYSEAFSILDRSLDRRTRLRGPDVAALHQVYGYALARLSRYDAAVEHFESALAQEHLDPRMRTEILFNLGQLYVAAQKFDEAVEAIEGGMANATEPNPAAEYALSLAHRRRGHPELALGPARRAVEGVESPREQWLAGLAALELSHGDTTRAIAALEQLAARFPRKQYWLALAEVHRRLGDPTSELAALERAYEENLLVTEAELDLLARLYVAQGLPERAEQIRRQPAERIDTSVLPPG